MTTLLANQDRVYMSEDQAQEKQAIVAALYNWIKQRPGLEYGNYGEPTSYRAEIRSITKDLHDARLLLRHVELSSVTADQLKTAFRAFSGRLSCTVKPVYASGKVAVIPGHVIGYTATLDYCTGQYWPTEYRRAAAAVCASALWDHYREGYAASAKKDESPGDAIRRNFRREYGRNFQERWFS